MVSAFAMITWQSCLVLAICACPTTVDKLIKQAELEAGDNAWVKASLESIKRYALVRDEARMSKEARYSSERMMTRMASVDEISDDYSLFDESQKAKHLRRKGEQGKRMD